MSLWTFLFLVSLDTISLLRSACILSDVGGSHNSSIGLNLVRILPVLPVESVTSEIVQAYIEHRVMPADPGGGALHLALASYHRSAADYHDRQMDQRDR